MSKPLILIGTPAYGGLITTGFLNSLLKTMTYPPIKDHYQIDIITIGNDALIQRARQELAKMAMDARAYKLMFIDADIIWEPEEFLDVIKHDKDVVGGTYRKKCAEPILNFNLTQEFELKFRQDHGDVPTNSFNGYKKLYEYADSDGLVQAKHLATGFLCIKISVFDRLKPIVDNYISDRRNNHKMQYSEQELIPLLVAELFPVRVQNMILESEDWGFCRLCEENGIKIWLQTRSIPAHMGNLPLSFPKSEILLKSPKLKDIPKSEDEKDIPKSEDEKDI